MAYLLLSDIGLFGQLPESSHIDFDNYWLWFVRIQ
jgi:hypothetical protein